MVSSFSNHPLAVRTSSESVPASVLNEDATRYLRLKYLDDAPLVTLEMTRYARLTWALREEHNPFRRLTDDQALAATVDRKLT